MLRVGVGRGRRGMGSSRRNYIRNSTMVGAVVGTPGTAPTFWGLPAPTGMTSEVVALGIESGIDYIDVRFSGTPSATNSRPLFEANNIIAATQGQTWTHSSYWKLVAGSLANVTSLQIEIRELASGVAVGTIGATPFTPNGTLTRASVTRTLADPTLTHVQPTLRFGVTSGAAVDITLRIGLPQIEVGSAATDPIRTAP